MIKLNIQPNHHTDGTDLYCDRNGKPLEQCINEFIQSL